MSEQQFKDELDDQINEKINENFQKMGIQNDSEEETKIESTENNIIVNESSSLQSDELSSSLQSDELEKSKEEIQQNLPEKVTEEQYLQVMNQAMAIAAVPVLKLIKRTTDLDYAQYLYGENPPLTTVGECEFRTKDKKQYALYLDIVDKDYDLNFGKYGEDEEIKKVLVQQCLRLTVFAQVLYNHIRDQNKELLEYHLTIDNNTTLYLDPLEKKRIGIRFEPRKYTEPPKPVELQSDTIN